jgi:hypothetical protein
MLSELVDFFKLDAFFLVLSQLTGLSLHRLAAVDSDEDDGEEEEEDGPSEPKRVKPQGNAPANPVYP